MRQYIDEVTKLIKFFQHFSITRVPRCANAQANKLSKLTSDSLIQLRQAIIIEEFLNPSIDNQVNILREIEEMEECWMTPIFQYLTQETLHRDKVSTRRIKLKAPQYVIQEGKLYRQSYLQLWLRCIEPIQADYVIREFHEDACDSYVGAWTLSKKIMGWGYYCLLCFKMSASTYKKSQV